MEVPEKQQKILVQLRLYPAEVEELRAAAKREGRSLPAEVLHRARLGRRSREYAVEHALADLAGLIASDALRTLGQPKDKKDRDRALSVFKAAMDNLLTELGVKNDLDEHERAVAFSLVWPALLQIRAKDLSPSARETDQVSEEEITLMRIGKALGYPKSKEAEQVMGDG